MEGGLLCTLCCSEIKWKVVYCARCAVATSNEASTFAKCDCVILNYCVTVKLAVQQIYRS